jgi:hypothetical protein
MLGRKATDPLIRAAELPKSEKTLKIAFRVFCLPQQALLGFLFKINTVSAG